MRTRFASAGRRFWNSYRKFAVLSVSSPPIETSASTSRSTRACRRCEAARLVGIVEILGRVDPLAGIGARRADQDAAAVAKATHVVLFKDAIGLIGHQPVAHRVVVHEVGVAVKDAQDFPLIFQEGDRGRGDHGVGRWGRATREDDGYAADVVTLKAVVGWHSHERFIDPGLRHVEAGWWERAPRSGEWAAQAIGAEGIQVPERTGFKKWNGACD